VAIGLNHNFKKVTTLNQDLTPSKPDPAAKPGSGFFQCNPVLFGLLDDAHGRRDQG
jgi:hypothetical protein